MAVHIGYDEPRAHQLIAGADVIAVPSRFEPCGLTQLYGLRYGTLPVVRRVGGLADTVTDAVTGTAANTGTDTATDTATDTVADRGNSSQTGFAFDAATPAAFDACMQRALALKADAAGWQAVMQRGMAQDLSWDGPARSYLALYRQAIAARAASPRSAGG